MIEIENRYFFIIAGIIQCTIFLPENFELLTLFKKKFNKS